MDDYHGILIKEGLRDQNILREIRILGQKKTRQWTLLKIGVEGRRIDETVQLVRKNLLTINAVPYYAHFYRDEELIVVFPERLFRVTPEKNTWEPVVRYGRSVGIPEAELDIKPCRFENETY